MHDYLINMFQPSKGAWNPGNIPDPSLRTQDIQANAAGDVEKLGDSFKYIVNQEAVRQAQQGMLAILEQLPQERVVLDRNKDGTYRLGRMAVYPIYVTPV
jgi:hypothetical protein